MKCIYSLVFICAGLLGSSLIFSKEKISTPAPAQALVQPEQAAPIVQNASLLLQSIQKDLQDPAYRDILPNNFSYLVQLLDFGKKTNQNREYAQNVLGLFSKLLKGSEYVNSYTFAKLIEQMPELLKYHFSAYQIDGTQLVLANDLDMLERLQQTVTSIVYTKFSTDFNTCKTNPEQFLQELSHSLVAATSQEVSMEQLRQIVIRFLEVGLSKLIWSPRDEEKTWESVKTISHNLATLMKYKIIDDLNDIDELYWTLVHRYRYFVGLHSTDMSLAFYSRVTTDISTQKLLLFDQEEQEPFMQSKSDCLLTALNSYEAKKRAFEYQITQAIA